MKLLINQEFDDAKFCEIDDNKYWDIVDQDHRTEDEFNGEIDKLINHGNIITINVYN